MSLEILSLPRVIFQPVKSVEVPNIQPDFPAVPSAKYYYNSYLGAPIPVLNNVGTPEEQQQALQIWYSLTSNEAFLLETVYAKSRNDQIGISGNNRPSSDLSLSMKGGIRQVPDSADWLFEDRFQLIIGQMKRQSINDFLADMYKFPLNPNSDSFEAARMIELYMNSGNDTPIRKYLTNCGVKHLNNHSFEYYPVYELFFLLTRFASPPMDQNQIELARRRNLTRFDSPARKFIDCIFHYNIYNLPEVLRIIDSLTSAPEVGLQFGTHYPDWVNWADEYLQNVTVQPAPIDNLGEVLSVLSQKLYTWTDDRIDLLAEQLDFELPFRSEHPTRFSWISQIAGALQTYRSNPAKLAYLKLMVPKSEPPNPANFNGTELLVPTPIE